MRALAAAMGLACIACGCARQSRLEAELRTLASGVQGFAVVELPVAPGRVVLSPEQSLTIERLRGVALDEHPPALRQPPKPCDAKMGDGFAPGEAPYVARGILPFRFRWFHNEFNYGGWHNFAMYDYALTHGFSILSPYATKPEDWRHLPKGTQFLKWGGFVNWEKWLPKHGIPEGRYDRLADPRFAGAEARFGGRRSLDVAGLLAQEGVFQPNPGFDSLMIDLEHPLLKPEQLRKQPWYPADGGEAFERRYYDGYAKTYIAPIEAARRAGWRHISLYGWQPFTRTWFGLDTATLDPRFAGAEARFGGRRSPATDWAWNAFGRAIYGTVDILNPSVYCFYLTSKNVAYTLANIDLNLRLVDSMPERKPVRPYYWTLLHGGGAGWRWWRGLPLPDEDVRAMTLFAFFAGVDGIVLWNWSGTASHHVPQLKADADLMVGRPFEAMPAGGGPAGPFARYEAIHVLEVAANDIVKFQRIEKENQKGNYGVSKEKPVYAMAASELAPKLRPNSEPVAAMIEGLALARPLEYLLRHGEVKTDVSAQEQFGKDLPIVRRVKLGRYHLLATYDPCWQAAAAPRQIVLDHFDGHPGLTLVLPADAGTRLFVLVER